MEKKIIAELEREAEKEIHSMVVVGHTIYVIDGKTILALDVPTETLWQKMGRFLGIMK